VIHSLPAIRNCSGLKSYHGMIDRYSSLPSSQLKQLPVPALAAPECLVVTWVTNRAKHLRFVKEELYPYWAVEVLAEWLWVKVHAKTLIRRKKHL